MVQLYSSNTTSCITIVYLASLSVPHRLLSFLALFDPGVSDFVSRGTVVAHAFLGRHLSVHSGFSAIAAQIQAKFCRKLPIRHIPRPFVFLFSKCSLLNFLRLFPFSLTCDPIGAKIAKHHSSSFDLI